MEKSKKRFGIFKKNVVFNIQSIIMSVLMAITLVTIVTMGFLLYQRFKLAIDKMAVSNTEATVESTVDRVNSDLLDIRQILMRRIIISSRNLIYPAKNLLNSSAYYTR